GGDADIGLESTIVDFTEEIPVVLRPGFINRDMLERDRRLQGAMLEARRKYGPNAVFKGMNLLEGATSLERNRQIGGHRA
ncbi:MAG: hypothetical protein ACSW8H_06145, partial [bacterium]